MTKPITKNPYALTTTSYYVWREGFEARQKSTLLPKPVSVIGRWWLSCDGWVSFVRADAYKAFQHELDTNPGACRWLSDEETREFE